MVGQVDTPSSSAGHRRRGGGNGGRGCAGGRRSAVLQASISCPDPAPAYKSLAGPRSLRTAAEHASSRVRTAWSFSAANSTSSEISALAIWGGGKRHGRTGSVLLTPRGPARTVWRPRKAAAAPQRPAAAAAVFATAEFGAVGGGGGGWSGVTGVERPIKRHFKPPTASEGSFDAPARAPTVRHGCSSASSGSRPWLPPQHFAADSELGSLHGTGAAMRGRTAALAGSGGKAEAEEAEETAEGYRARARARAWGLGAAVFAALAGLEALRPPLLLVGPATVDVVHGARRPVRALPAASDPPTPCSTRSADPGSLPNPNPPIPPPPSLAASR